MRFFAFAIHSGDRSQQPDHQVAHSHGEPNRHEGCDDGNDSTVNIDPDNDGTVAYATAVYARADNDRTSESNTGYACPDNTYGAACFYSASWLLSPEQ